MAEMGNVWDRTTEFLSDNARALLPIAVLALFIPHSVNALIGSAGEAANPLVASLVTLACTLIALWGQLAVIALALDPDGGRRGATAAATRAFGPSIIAMLIVLAVLAVLLMPIFGTLMASGVDLASLRGGAWARDVSTGAAAFVSIYAVVLAIVVFVAAIRLALLYPVIVREGGMIGAIRRAVALTRGMVWRMIGVWLLFVIVYLVANAAATTAVGTLIGLVVGPLTPFGVGSCVVAILSGLVSTAFTLVIGAFSAKLYLAAIAAREGAAAA